MCSHKEHRCTGHCCRHFFIPYSYEELQEMLDPTKTISRCEDCEIIARMVIPVEPPMDLVEDLGILPNAKQHCYTCRHLLPNNDCLIYAARPKMCRDYPYGTKCKYPGCTYTGIGKK